MATITEHTIKMTEGSDVYIMRPMLLSDKTFFIETMADFPYEKTGVNSERTFDKYVYSWVMCFKDSDFPIAKGHEKVSTFIISKNDTPFCMTKLTYDNFTGTLYERDPVVAFHPSQRGKGLYRKYLDICHYWTYVQVGIEYSTYQTYDKVVQIYILPGM